MKRLMATVALGLSMTIGGVAVAQEDKITKGFYSFDAMGCMLLKECTDGVEKIKSTEDLQKHFLILIGIIFPMSLIGSWAFLR